MKTHHMPIEESRLIGLVYEGKLRINSRVRMSLSGHVLKRLVHGSTSLKIINKEGRGNQGPVQEILKFEFIMDAQYTTWLSNFVLVKK